MSAVDTSIPPSPTGPAAATAASHSSPSPLRLYGAWFCPFVQRAWIVLVEKSIPHQYTEVNPYLKPPSLLGLNPRGLVPTLRVPGDPPRALYESLVICEYLDDAYGDDGPPLLPRGDPFERARCRLWIDHISTRVVPSFYRLLQHDPTRSTYTLPGARADLAAHIGALVREMDPAGPWFLASGFSLVDVALAPWAMRLFVIDRYKEGGAGIPPEGEGEVGGKGEREEEREEERKVWERWGVWMEAVRGRRSVRETWSEEEEYVKVYKRYADDTTQSLVGKATGEGRGLP